MLDSVKEQKKRARLEKQDRLRADPASRRTCKLCLQSKPLMAFSIDRSRSDGCFAWCKACSKVRRRQYYEANRDLIAFSSSMKRSLDPDAAHARDRLYYQRAKDSGYLDRNRDKANERTRKYMQKDSAQEKRRNAALAWRERNPERYIEEYKRSNRQASERLSDSLIAGNLARFHDGKVRIDRNLVPLSLVEAKREQLKIYRLLNRKGKTE